MEVKIDDLQGAQVKALLNTHLHNASKYSPADSVFALDLDALCRSDITFWTAWQKDKLLGCGALKQLNLHHGEIKSMHTLAESRGKGVGSKILEQIITAAKDRNYQTLSLETGTDPAYFSAHKLYKNFAFVECSAFGEYSESTHSKFMTLALVN